MDKEKVIEWLDKQVEANNIINEALSETTYRIDYPTCKKIGSEYVKTIHLANIEEIADVLGITPLINERDDEDYPIERYFIYKGYVVFKIIRKEDL